VVRPVDALGLGPTYEIAKKANNYVEVTVTPGSLMGPNPIPGVILLSPDQYERFLEWRKGRGLIQDLFPELTQDEREILMTGL